MKSIFYVAVVLALIVSVAVGLCLAATSNTRTPDLSLHDMYRQVINQSASTDAAISDFVPKIKPFKISLHEDYCLCLLVEARLKRNAETRDIALDYLSSGLHDNKEGDIILDALIFKIEDNWKKQNDFVNQVVKWSLTDARFKISDNLNVPKCANKENPDKIENPGKLQVSNEGP